MLKMKYHVCVIVSDRRNLSLTESMEEQGWFLFIKIGFSLLLNWMWTGLINLKLDKEM